MVHNLNLDANIWIRNRLEKNVVATSSKPSIVPELFFLTDHNLAQSAGT